MNFGIKVKFNLVLNVNYMLMLWENLKVGKVGDLIICCLFDDFLVFFKVGYLVEIIEMVGMENFLSFV